MSLALLPPSRFVLGASRVSDVRAEQVGQREVRPRTAPFVEQAAVAGGNQTAAARDKAPHAGDLRIRHGAEIREHQHGELRRIAFNVVGVNRQVRNARADQRLRDAAPREVHQQVRVVAPEEIGVLLRPHDADAGDWAGG